MLFSLVLTIFAVTVLDASSPSRTGRVDPPATGVLGTLMYSLLSMLVSLPSAIITYRYGNII